MDGIKFTWDTSNLGLSLWNTALLFRCFSSDSCFLTVLWPIEEFKTHIWDKLPCSPWLLFLSSSTALPHRGSLTITKNSITHSNRCWRWWCRSRCCTGSCLYRINVHQSNQTAACERSSNACLPDSLDSGKQFLTCLSAVPSISSQSLHGRYLSKKMGQSEVHSFFHKAAFDGSSREQHISHSFKHSRGSHNCSQTHGTA